MQSFKIPLDRLEHRVTSFRPAACRRPGSGSVTYSKDRYCDDNLFARQVGALWNYIQQVRPAALAVAPENDYWSMSDEQLDQLATKYNIGGYGDNMGHIDRDTLITQLLKRDRALQPKKLPPTYNHTINVGGNMTDSVIQQGTRNSQANVTFNATAVRDLVERIKPIVDELPISVEAKEELRSDIQSIEPQLSSSRPKMTIIETCMTSMQRILLEASAHTAAILAAEEIRKLLPTLHHVHP